MPIKKKQKSGRDTSGASKVFDKDKSSWLSTQAQDLAGLATHAPAGALRMGKQIFSLDPSEHHKFYREQMEGIKPLADKEAWKEHTAMNLIGALGLAAPPLKGVSAVSAAAKAGRGGRIAALKNVNKDPKTGKPKTRKIEYRIKNEAEAELFKQVAGSKNLKVATQSVVLPQSKVVTTAAMQKALDTVRRQFPAWQKKKVLKGVARDRDILNRRDSPDLQAGFMQASKDAVSKEAFQSLKKNPIKSFFREGNAGVRGLRLYRPGYIGPNVAGAVATNLIEGGPIKTARAGYSSRKLRMQGEGGGSKKGKAVGKNLDPRVQKIMDQKDAVMGEGAAQGAAELAGAGPVATFTRGVGQSLGKVTDREARRRHFDREAREQGYDPGSIESMEKLMRSRSDLIQVARRAEDSAIRFTRNRPLPGVKNTPLQKLDRLGAENLFLYRWLTGSGAYTGRMLKEHPTLTQALAASGEEAPAIQDVLEEYPKFMERYIPAGVRGKLPLVSNMQAATLFDSPGGAIELAKRINDDPRNAIDPLNPIQRAIGVGGLGYDPFRGQELKTKEDPTPGWKKRIQFGADVETRSIPYRTLLEGLALSDDVREGKLFPRTREDLLKTFLLGGPTPTPVNPIVAKSMARSEAAKKSGTKKRKRKKKSSGF